MGAESMIISSLFLIISNSKHVLKRIEKYWRKKSKVIYPPVNVKNFDATEDHEDYFLIVSALNPGFSLRDR